MDLFVAISTIILVLSGTAVLVFWESKIRSWQMVAFMLIAPMAVSVGVIAPWAG